MTICGWVLVDVDGAPVCSCINRSYDRIWAGNPSISSVEALIGRELNFRRQGLKLSHLLQNGQGSDL